MECWLDCAQRSAVESSSTVVAGWTALAPVVSASWPGQVDNRECANLRQAHGMGLCGTTNKNSEPKSDQSISLPFDDDAVQCGAANTLQ